MTWIVIILVLLIAFGPVLWLVPTKKDRRLSALRARARREGLVVEIRRIRNPDPKPEERVTAGGRILDPAIECASYAYPLTRKLRRLPMWRVIRRPSDTGQPDPLPGWSYDLRPKGEGRRYLDRLMVPVKVALSELPGDVMAFEVGPTSLHAYWLEKPGADEAVVSEMAETLRRLDAAFRDLEDGIAEELKGEDS